MASAAGVLFDGASASSAIAAAREHGYRLAEIVAHLGVHESTVSRRLRRSAASGECKKGA
jgi:IS30 family transposase